MKFIKFDLNSFFNFLGIALQLFEHLWDSGEAVCNDAFLKWEADTTKLEGKGLLIF